jgi:calcium homeostasis ER protein
MIVTEQQLALTPQAHPPTSTGIPLSSITEASLRPKLPYYELPAGLMVPTVSMEDCTYKPIKVSEMRVPPATPPNEYLQRQVERFYQFQSMPDNPRDK